MAIPHEPHPYTLFDAWFQEAKACADIRDATAMTLATADATGAPDARIVLLKARDDKGFVFFTNLGSAKARQLAENPRAALCFHWAPLTRQIRIRGPVEAVNVGEADEYFGTRPKQSQIGAWASRQSTPYAQRQELEDRLAHFSEKYVFTEVPRPEFWSGFRIQPEQVEFWLEQPFRLHDRVLYTREGEVWTTARLFP